MGVINNKQQKYSITLASGENVKILLDDVEVFNETVGQDYIAIIQLNYNESKQ